MQIQGVLKHVSQAKKLGTGKWQIMTDRGYINTVFRFMRLPAAKVEKILKGSLDLISSPSVKIQIMGGKVCLWQKGKTLLGILNELFVFKSLFTTPSNFLTLHLSRP